MADLTNTEKLDFAIKALEGLGDEIKSLYKEVPILETEIAKAILVYIAKNPDDRKMSHKKLEYFACSGNKELEEQLVKVLELRLRRRFIADEIKTIQDSLRGLQTLVKAEGPL